MALTPKQQCFVEEYIVDLNATQAAIRAGYSARSAVVTGARLLANANVAAAVQSLKDERSQRTEVTADRVLKALAAVAFGDVRALFNEDGNMIQPSKLSDEAASMVAGIEIVTSAKGDGEVERVAKIKTNDRLRALELIGRHLSMFTDKLEVAATVDLVERMAEARKRAGRA